MRYKTNIYGFLFEKEDKDTDSPEKSIYVKSDDLKARKSLYSLDNQIDSLILRYENASIREDSDTLAEISFNNKSLKYLFEQEEDPLADLSEEEAPAEETPEAAEDVPAPSPSGSEEAASDKPAENKMVPNLDIDAFTSRAVRLISNPDKLLDLETVIVNRIKNFLDENYGDEFVVRFTDTLLNEYGIEITEFDEGEMTQVNNDVFAPGANPAATGGSGG